jgi:hypothetical protein
MFHTRVSFLSSMAHRERYYLIFKLCVCSNHEINTAFGIVVDYIANQTNFFLFIFLPAFADFCGYILFAIDNK